MAEIKRLLDEFGIIHEANKVLPDDAHKLDFLQSLAELEDNQCHRTQTYPKTRLHRVTGYEKAIYRADINKTSGWRLHLQFDKKNQTLVLKDIVPGQQHDDVIKVIKAKKNRYD
jgi:hypothetical protein